MAIQAIDRSRQEMDARFDQARVSKARVMIVGSGPAAILAAICSATMGFERIVLAANPSIRPCPSLDSLLPLEDWLGWRYPDAPVVPIDPFTPARLARILAGELDAVIVDLGSALPNVGPVVAAVEPSRRVLMHSDANQVTLSVGGDAPPAALLSASPSLDAAMLAAGLAVGEVRRIVAPCPDDCAPDGLLSFHLPSPARSMGEVAIAGAGGTGSFFAPAVASFCRGPVRIYDPDDVEQSNLCRCPFLTGPGNNKAVDLSRHPAVAIVPVEPRPEPAGLHWLDKSGPDVVAAFCTDTLASRRALNAAACARGVPAVNMGTSLWGAVVNTITADTQCMECRFPNLNERIEAEIADGRANSCGRRPEASAAISNMVAAGAAAMVARRLRSRGFSFPGSLVYDAFEPRRLYVTSIRQKCGCFGRKEVLS
jgi:molybdopterin/thiamine biosynthesis adenylyltransferase